MATCWENAIKGGLKDRCTVISGNWLEICHAAATFGRLCIRKGIKARSCLSLPSKSLDLDLTFLKGVGMSSAKACSWRSNSFENKISSAPLFSCRLLRYWTRECSALRNWLLTRSSPCASSCMHRHMSDPQMMEQIPRKALGYIDIYHFLCLADKILLVCDTWKTPWYSGAFEKRTTVIVRLVLFKLTKSK